jgi:Cys-tRNA(Pro)/Cys-tRNA(Cys) deacylase
MHERIEQLLETNRVPFRARYHHDYPVPIRRPADFAKALGYDLERIAKTILLRNQAKTAYCLATLPANYRLNLRAIADGFESGHMELASPQELKSLLDYPPMSVSPLGAGTMVVFIDQKLREFETILVGAGAVGVEIEITPAHVIELAGARIMDIAANEGGSDK